MSNIEPVESGDRGVPVWVVAGVAVGVVLLLGVAGWLAVRTMTDGESTIGHESEEVVTTLAPTTLPGAPTISGGFVIDSDFDSTSAVLFRPGGELIDGKACAGVDSDIEPGAQMRVTDENGTLLGTGVLGNGVLVLSPNIDDYTVPTGSSSERKSFVYRVSDCVHEFTIPLSGESEFYTVTVGNLGGQGYSRSETYGHMELASFGWYLELAP